MPIIAQSSSISVIETCDYNSDNNLDLLIFGNKNFVSFDLQNKESYQFKPFFYGRPGKRIIKYKKGEKVEIQENHWNGKPQWRKAGSVGPKGVSAK